MKTIPLGAWYRRIGLLAEAALPPGAAIEITMRTKAVAGVILSVRFRAHALANVRWLRRARRPIPTSGPGTSREGAAMHYIYREEDAEYVADLEFDARSHEEIHDLKLPPPPARARLRVRRRGAFFAKTNRLGDVSVPGAPWFNTRIMALMDGTLFVGVDHGLLLVDPATANVQQRIRTGNTEVAQIMPDHDRRRIYVVNEAYGFAAEPHVSNVAAFEHDGTLA